MIIIQNSFIPKRPFFANKKNIFAKFSRTPYLFFAGPILANNPSYKNLFTTYRIIPENYGSFLSSLLNMQLTSRNPFSGQIFFAKFGFNFRPLFRIIFAEFSRKYPYSQIPAISRGCTEGKAKTTTSLLEIWLQLLAFSGALLLPDPGRQWVAALYI